MKRFLPLILLPCILLGACAKAVPTDTQTINYTVPVGTQKYVDPEQGLETWFAIGALTEVSEVNANGVVQAHRFQSGLYRIELQLNIDRAKEGEFYEVWLAKPDDPVIVIAGQLHSTFGDVRHTLEFESEDDLRAYTNVIVTRELDDGNPQPNERMAEGTLKVTER